MVKAAKRTTLLLVLRRPGRHFLPAEAQRAILRGTIADQTGARVAGAQVTLHDSVGAANTAQSDEKGTFSFTDLTPGTYRLDASAPGMGLEQPLSLVLRPGVQNLNLSLVVQATRQQIEVQDQSETTISAEAVNNASSLTLRGNDLQSLGDSQEDFSGSAGPSGAVRRAQWRRALH